MKGGVRPLSGSGFCLLTTPSQRHNLANFIYAEEKKIHRSEEEAMLCMRTKGHSSKEMACCLDHLDPPGKLKIVKHVIIEQPLNWILKRNNFINQAIACIFIGALPVFKITLFMWDFSKDNALVFYLSHHR